MEIILENILGLSLGLGLAAACGFRVFVPLFFVGLFHRLGHLDLASDFEWMSSDIALWCFGGAMLFEILGYYIPWVDNLLDTVASPAAVVAGTIMTMGMLSEMSPFLEWTLGIVAGGGTSLVVQTGTVSLRGASSATTGGLGNPVVATGELAAAGVLITLSVLLPWFVGILAILLVVWMFRKILHFKKTLATAATS